MKKLIIPSLLLMILLLVSCGQKKLPQQDTEPIETELESEDTEKKAEIERITPIVTAFIDYVKAGKEELSKHITYPLNRDYPIPPIKDRKEFLKRYDEIFDAILLKMIVDSDITNWSEVGWRGIMLNNGDVWIDEYDDGVKLQAINYQSNAETNKKEALINDYRNSVHESLRKFENPIAEIKTKSYLIKIDYIGNDLYRYASWKVGSSISEKPDLILTNGILSIEGSMANHVYSFTNGNYIYQCYFSDYLKKGLIIFKDAQLDENGYVFGGTEILNQNGI